MITPRLRAVTAALALTALLAGCAAPAAEPTEAPSATTGTPTTEAPSATAASSTLTPSASSADERDAPSEAPGVTVAPPAPEPPAWSGPTAVDTTDWQTFTMPGGEASFRLPPTWEVRGVHAFAPGTAEPAGYAHVYTDDGEHLLGLHLDAEPWTLRCDGPGIDARVLHEEPVELAIDTPGQLSTQVRFDALGVSGSMSISLTDGRPDAEGCTDSSVDVTSGANGIASVAFGTGSPGPSLSSPPSFAGFSSAGRALELVDQDRLAAAWTIVRSLEVHQ
ncbi:hypothetical protein ABIB37_000670 [Agrococcus sp. UYP10]|uniref:hypothetical protein n=1 Tax=Agrococcus sp. UYP10 TaxID=1756355 RepID=UPI0033915739